MKKIDPKKLEHLKELLSNEENFPLKYTFKFIVPTEQLTRILGLFPDEKNINTKPSSKGKYISVTVVRTVKSAEEVTQVYESVSVIDGVISL
ncbi:MAG: DUF493 domain-containing protein [Bdellovibrionota bacterium]|jgi:putative lipoic acid-binding regulatory protein|nr:DUF493 domain-containing protein [Bdellovibrionota bacterium]